MKVLIADDEPGTRLLLSATLERLGHECVAAEDGDAAWERFLAEEPAVVVTDWQMPGLDGTEIARRIRERPAAAYTYVVVLTGAADEASARAAMEAGADDVLLKPLDAADLERKLIAAERVTAMHRRLHADARHDPLTGIGNRLRLAEDLEAVCGRVERYGHAYCVAIADVDRFKAYNDAHGHPRGDDVLRAVRPRCAMASAPATRSTATAARSSWCSCPSRRSPAPSRPPSACARRSRRSRSPIPAARA
jgi:two-component system chemotaxis response regulator CheY